MLKILINAYACSPNMGSEPGMAWNWCINLAIHCDLYIITEGEFRDKIEAELPNLSQGKNMHFYYNSVSEKVRKMCWNQGDWRFYPHYKKWQYKTMKIAQSIIADNGIDIIHHLNMIGFREPGYLWKIKDIPLIWGPINAKEAFPLSYLSGASLKNKLFIHTKFSINKLQLQASTRVKKMIERSSSTIAASSDSANALRKYYKYDPIVLNESGTENKFSINNPRNLHTNTLHILWIGRFIFTKQLILALLTIKELKNLDIQLHVVGGSFLEEKKWKTTVKKMGIEKKIVWHGKISHSQVQDIMKKCHIFFFTSISEGTPHVVLEAISNNLPVLCFDTCGQGDSINDKVGRKIRLSNPKQSVQDFAHHLNYFFAHREVLKDLSSNCKQRQHELSWDAKVKVMLDIYNHALTSPR